MSKDKISEPCFFRANQEQMKIIQERFKQSGVKSFSGFLRQQVVQGIYLEYDKEEQLYPVQIILTKLLVELIAQIVFISMI